MLQRSSYSFPDIFIEIYKDFTGKINCDVGGDLEIYQCDLYRPNEEEKWKMADSG